MSLLDELFEPLTQEGCFAYCKETHSCSACTDLLCEQDGKCPFFKPKAKWERECQRNATKLLKKMQTDLRLKRRLELLGITESDLIQSVASEDVLRENSVI